LQANLPEIRATVPDATYLMWFDCSALVESGTITGNLHEFFLKEAKVALNNGADFGPSGENFVRFNLASPRSVLEEALSKIKDSLY
jgi:cystathionine beta-lyase